MAEGGFSGGFDDCICACIYAMRRLMEAIRAQNLCSDTGCLDQYPSLQQPPVTGEYTQLLMILFIWIIIAIIMYIYRPNSLRSPRKAPSMGDRDGSGAPPTVN